MRFACSICILALAVTASRAWSDAAAEAALLSVWATHQGGTGEHARVRAAAESFTAAYPASPLASVAQGIAGWHALKANDTAGAAACFNPVLSIRRPLVVEAVGQEMARRWLTRLDRERVKASLLTYYQEEVGFPSALSELQSLPEADRPPFEDRWGSAWVYRSQSMRRISVTGQRYTLESIKLKDRSDLAVELAAGYAPFAGLTVGSLREAENRRALNVVIAGEKTIVEEGSGAGALKLAFLGEQIAIFSDGDRWDVRRLPEPR